MGRVEINRKKEHQRAEKAAERQLWRGKEHERDSDAHHTGESMQSLSWGTITETVGQRDEEKE